MGRFFVEPICSLKLWIRSSVLITGKKFYVVLLNGNNCYENGLYLAYRKAGQMELEQQYIRFKSQGDCIKHLEQIRWNGIPRCPHCNSIRQTPQPKEQRYHCGICRASYSVTVRTVFHNTKIDLQKWFLAIPLVIKERLSVRQLALAVQVSKDTASLMIERVRLALKEDTELINHFLN